jgi:hypothetical protein
MAKVRCRFCEFEESQKCKVKKNTKVKINKKRVCSVYNPNEEKILDFLERRENSSKPQVVTRPDWWWSKKARRAERDRVAKLEMDQYQTTAAFSKEHPLTGDLSRFIQPTIKDKSNT